MYRILYSLFLDNPEIPKELYHFCQTFPGYQEKKADYDRLADQVCREMGDEFYARLEEAMNAYQSYEIRACYLFGLKLRREVLEGMERA